MEKTELRNLFETPFNLKNWLHVMQTLFKVKTIHKQPIGISLPSNNLAKSAYELGNTITSDERLIGFYQVNLKSNVWIAANRVGLRNLLRNVYKYDVDGALIVFVNERKWRFSFVSEIREINDYGEIVTTQTEPKRYTYLMGDGDVCRTASDRFYLLYGKSFSLDDIREAFSVEKLNKEFYQELSNWYFWALQNVRFPDDFEEDEEVRNATSVIRLITRLIFIWFLKHKGLIRDELFDEKELKQILNYSDKTGSTFYKAILQNLFFATLNTEMGCEHRKFVYRQYGVQGFYRYERFFTDKERFLELTRNIPFLNGGLFENLDKNVGEPDEIRIDCFSNKIANEIRLSVPDYLFFNGADDVDLSRSYGDSNHGHVKIRGLIKLLKSYNFTIEENTPFEMDVALDPELLGKVFENLLASYNPETKTTARKQTGSFYTPREIVNYMVDESILAYLKNQMLEENTGFAIIGSSQMEMFGNDTRKGQLSIEQKVNSNPWIGNESGLEINLRLLLDYNNETNPFNEKDSLQLMRAIDNCRILDPACGSGAFPMGILQKLVLLLQKLDKDNKHWLKIQQQRAKVENQALLNRIQKDKEYALQISFGDIRKKLLKELDERLEEIKETFDTNINKPDYARKLFLVENCIYGVDIQPIAVQIAKLRFFISLVIDQKIDDNKPNRGILILPNLETKFVAANTMIGFSQIKTTKPISVYPLENELKEVRHRHFSARTPETKKKYRELDAQLREQISNELKKVGYPSEDADKIAHWNPYDQNTFAKFYDSEWMFGIIQGFDILIGNPPYIAFQRMEAELKKSIKEQGYKTYENTGDIYTVFYEKGVKLLKDKGILTYITSRQWMQASYGKSLRRFFALETNPFQLIDFGQVRIFDGATVFVNVILLEKSKNKNSLWACLMTSDYNVEQGNLLAFFISNKQKIKKLTENTWYVSNAQHLNEQIEKIGKPLKKWEKIEFYAGIKTALNDAFHIKESLRNELIKKDNKNIEIIKPLLRGKDIKRYHYDFESWYMINTHNGVTSYNLPRINVIKDYPIIYEHLKQWQSQLEARLDKGEHWTNLRNCAFLMEFEKPKIVWIEISDRANYAYDDNGMYLTNSAYFLTCKDEKVSLKYLLAVLNSKVADFYFSQKTARIAGGRMRYTKQFVEQVPIPEIPLSKQEPFIKLADIILFLRNQHFRDSSDEIMYLFFEEVVDCAVVELYFEDEIKKHQFEIVKHLKPIMEPMFSITTDSIRKVFHEFEQPSHPVHKAVMLLKKYEPLKTIEETLNRSENGTN